MLVRPWLTPFVVLFWLATSGWLLVEKILPTLAPGTPPGQQSFFTSHGMPVAWTVYWNDQPLGWSLSQSHREDDGGMEVENTLHFDRLPMNDILPSWTKLILGRSFDPKAICALDARGHLSIDPAGSLRAFRSVIGSPLSAEQVVLNGMIDKGQVTVLVSAGDAHYSTSRRLPTNISLGDELSPQARLPGLFPNRRWTVPVYSPLRPGQAPVEILHAHVAAEEALYWGDALVRVNVVHYRDDPAGHHEPRCRVWVDRSGNVLKQESVLLGSRLVFMRRTDEAAERLLSTIGVEPSGLELPARLELPADAAAEEPSAVEGPT
jgi:hypothetical protein